MDAFPSLHMTEQDFNALEAQQLIS